MAEASSIEWTDATWNPITGCSVISPGCRRCYAMRLAGTRMKAHPSRAGLTQPSAAGPVWNGQVRLNEGWLEQPLQWTRARRIFVCAHSDLFHEAVPDEWIIRVYGVMVAAVHLHGHTLQVLTKRPERARQLLGSEAFWDEVNALASHEVMDRVDPLDRRSDDARASLDDYGPESPPPGIWLGISAENQHWLMVRGPQLMATPAERRFFSLEPLLAEVDVEPFVLPVRGWSNGWLNNYPLQYPKRPIDLVIVGGENAADARPMHPTWVREVRDACADAGVPFLFKQWGTWAPGENAPPIRGPQRGAYWFNDRWDYQDFTKGEAENLTAYDEPVLWKVGKKAAGRHLDGCLHDGLPG